TACWRYLMRKRFWLLGLLILLGVGIFMTDEYLQPVVPSAATTAQREPDYYGEGLTSKRFNQQGKLSQVIEAEKSTHYPDSDKTFFEKPKMITLNGKQWQMTAATGQLDQKNNLLMLDQDVWVIPYEKDASSDNALSINNLTSDVIANDEMPNMSIQTTSLTYQIEPQIATTDDLVIIRNDNNVMRGTGMKLEISKQRMQLNSGVTTRYEPQ
ncbi:MAG: LPS export ABC transporter periplasmic protein LptC, partial [Oleibacter sp.]|nr:LPS export ABC transporter periplasmic protein LptC [Thalassolituus sp.]